MTLLQGLLHLTDFGSQLLRTSVPSITAAVAIQTAFAIPSIIAQSERFYDFSGSLTFLSVTALSLYLPALRARYGSGVASNEPLPSLLSPFLAAGGRNGFNWRQVALSGAVAIWAMRRMLMTLPLTMGVVRLTWALWQTQVGSYLFHRILKEGKDSRFDRIRGSPSFFAVVWVAQAVWVSVSLLPVLAVNSIPTTAFAAIPTVKFTDILGFSLFVGGLLFEVVADWQKSKWLEQKKAKVHDEEFLTRGLWSRRLVFTMLL